MSSPALPLRPLSEEEYPAFVERAVAFYVSDMVAAGIEPDVAAKKAERDFPAVLPDGLATEGHLFYVIEDEGRPAGYLWLADRDGELGRSLFVYGVEVYEEARGKGLGRAAMLFAEDEARRLGIPRVALNVFGGNDVARGLYLKLGYLETAIHMEKRV